MKYTSEEIAGMIDHSLLRPNLTDDDIRAGCAVARKYGVASVCCAPSQVPLVKVLLDGSGVATSTVIGFPHGYSTTETKVAEARQAVREGATELDMVINISKLLSGDFDYVERDVAAVCAAAREEARTNGIEDPIIVKVILENCYLTDGLKVRACQMCERAGADFVKTSTGFGSGGATFADLRLMRKAVSEKVQVKAAGGIRELDTALLVRAVGATRFGCTATAAVLDEAARRVAAGEE
jgi:deoxyribose-phosphate aldolase